MALANPGTHYTYADLATFPNDNLRREIIDGELIVNPAPAIRHQIASSRIHLCLMTYAQRHGGLALAAPTDVFLTDQNVVEPDLLFVRADHLERVGESNVKGPPDLVVEISSPTTRRLELVRKRELYERFAVPEYWYVDLDAERVEVYRFAGGIYPVPEIKYPGALLKPSQLPGLQVPVDDALAVKPPTANRQ